MDDSRTSASSASTSEQAIRSSSHAWGQEWTSPSSLEYKQFHQLRGYKSYKKSLKPLNTTANWKAAEPYLNRKELPKNIAQDRSQPQGPIVDSCIPPVPEAPKPIEYQKVGQVTGRYNLELQQVFAVIQIAGTQFKVTVDDVFFTNQLHGCDINDVLELRQVMLLGSSDKTIIGRPYIPDASVLVAVEEHFRDGKVHIFKKRRRKRHRVYKTARSHLMTLRVLAVRGIEPARGDELKTDQVLPIRWNANEEAFDEPATTER